MCSRLKDIAKFLSSGHGWCTLHRIQSQSEDACDVDSNVMTMPYFKHYVWCNLPMEPDFAVAAWLQLANDDHLNE
jgi:hypothetical protein